MGVDIVPCSISRLQSRSRKAETGTGERQMKKGSRTVIFDMDGVIIDSEPLHLAAYNIVLGPYAVHLREEEFIRWCVGRRSSDIVAFLRKHFQLPESVEQLLAEKNTAYTSMVRENMRPMPGLLPLLDHLTSSAYRLAVASSASVADIEEILAGLRVRQHFQLIVSGEEVPNGKPSPDIFLEAARRLGVSPEECVVIEDSQKGVEAAVQAGMYCIAVPNRFTAAHDFSCANIRVPNLLTVSTLL
jgi:beta-phosphoglucomutase family hydrolase